ncbi:MAG: hypothetical protein J7L55_04820 [Desulfurococcales archaeon]|nr:hypothetical protein [Desulfurococcales archaeon]
MVGLASGDKGYVRRQYHNDFRRGRRHGFRDRQRQERRASWKELKQKPMPIGDKCNPLCPYFRCSKKALVFVNRVVKGHVQKVAMCRWIGDECLGPKCQYAYCELGALLPDGRCAYAVKFKKSGDEFFKELEEEGKEFDSKVKDLLSRRTGRRNDYLE